MNMIERVARAIYEVDGGEGWHLHSKFYLDSARAAIESMREPTEDMIKRGISKASGFAEAGNRMCNGYRVRIDAALEKK